MGRIHHDVEGNYFTDNPDHRPLFKRFLPDFDIKWAAVRTDFRTEYAVFFLKPERHVEEMFGFDREILFVYAKYAKLEPRLFQAIDSALSTTPASGRVDPLVVAIISPADNLPALIERQQLDNAQTRIFVPFSESECLAAGDDAYFARNRFRTHLFARDLFDVSQPITSDLYFFGRSGLLVELQDGLRSGRNYGVFGLRKMGKTSLLFKLKRTLEQNDLGTFLYFDLQDAALYRLAWWQLLDEIRRGITGPGTAFKASSGPDEAARAFRSAVEARRGGLPIVVALDEIEHIAPRLRMEAHWDREFLDLWKTLRAVQNTNRHVTFVVAGVNATVIETPTYSGHDNPLFAMAQVRYMPAFDVAELRTMVRTLGRPMGLHFSENAYPYLLERYGGHPSLTRMACSRTHHRTASIHRPVMVQRADFSAHEAELERSLLPTGEHVLGLLKDWYPDEYEMLEILASGDIGSFDMMSQEAPEYSEHLKSYGLIDTSPPRIRIPFLQTCLQRATKGRSNSQANALTGVNKTVDAEGSTPAPPLTDLMTIGALRNRLEPLLRRYIKRTLKAHLGPERWIDPIIKVVPSGAQRDKLAGLDRDVILNERLFLLNLITVVDQNWEYFKGLEACPPDRQVTKEQFKVLLTFVNAHREDAHAKPVSTADVATLRLVTAAIEGAINYLLED